MTEQQVIQAEGYEYRTPCICIRDSEDLPDADGRGGCNLPCQVEGCRWPCETSGLARMRAGFTPVVGPVAIGIQRLCGAALSVDRIEALDPELFT